MSAPASSDPALLETVRQLLTRAAATFAGTAEEAGVRAVLDSLDEPLRVAIAGKVKAGKSTMLNALVGEELAPTDAGECTTIVTWYRHGTTYRVMLEPRTGEARQVPFRHDAGSVSVDLQGTPAEDVERLVVDWPTRRLEPITLIDTPGLGSLSEHVSERTTAFLTPGDDRVTEADAVLYLMKHLHASDVGFLEAFHDEAVSQATPVNAIAVLSRADEVGVGRLDAMESAQRIAARYRDDPKVRRLAQTVVPVAGLLAGSGSTLRQVEFEALRSLADTPPAEQEGLLLSVDRFVDLPTTAGLTSLERQALLERFGIFGIRLSTDLLRRRQVTTAGQLSAALVEHSGLNELRAVLLAEFGERRGVLKARSGLLAIETALRRLPSADDGTLAADVERISASAHEFNELRLLNSLRTGSVVVKAADVPDMERLIGTHGSTPSARLGLAPDAEKADLLSAAHAAMNTWQRRAESPMSDPSTATAARILVRTCEGMLVDLTR